MRGEASSTGIQNIRGCVLLASNAHNAKAKRMRLQSRPITRFRKNLRNQHRILLAELQTSLPRSASSGEERGETTEFALSAECKGFV